MSKNLISTSSPTLPISLDDSINNLFDETISIQITPDSVFARRVKENKSKALDQLHFYKIMELSYEKEFPRREAFENVISSFNNEDFNLIFFLSGTRSGVSIYLGIKDNYKIENPLSTINSFDASESLINSFKGNYLGSKVDRLSDSQINTEIIKKISESKRRSIQFGVPSENEDNPADESVFQGIDRLINSMRGEVYQYVIVCEPMTKKAIEARLRRLYDYYNQISIHAERDLSANTSAGNNVGVNDGKSSSRGKNKGTSTSKGRSSSTGSEGESEGRNSSRGTSQGSSESESKNTGRSFGINSSTGKSVNVKVVQKGLKEQIQYLDDELIPRIKLGRAKGLYKTAIYAMAQDNATLFKLEGNIRSILQGEQSSFAPLQSARLSALDNDDKSITQRNTDFLSLFQIYQSEVTSIETAYLLQNLEVSGLFFDMGTLLTAKEISLLAGFPMNEVPGIRLNEAVDFGVNIPESSDGIELGNIIQRGRELDNRVFLSREVLNKHIFISGVTGSGKTTTAQKILLEFDMPFLVIEPAKTEYRQLHSFDKSVIYYTAGRNDLAPFKINPMELVRGEQVSSHIDMLMATFQAVYPLEASMPYILKEAIINCYEKLGWDLGSNENRYAENPWHENGLYWPTFSHLVKELTVVVNSKGFASDFKNNYIGSLVSRFSDLTNGSRGSIFDVLLSIDFESLLERKVVLELDELKSEEDKILIMGFVLTRVREVLKRKHEADPNFRHITLIEEAHRLLSKPDPGETSKKMGVQIFTDMLSEVRKYGECLIIVDQIPNKLTPEVMKNTNTKIAHKIFADDDKTAIAHTIALEDKQKQFLSKLNVGEAIVFSEGWHKPVWVKINASAFLSQSVIKESDIADLGRNLLRRDKAIYFPAFKNIGLNDNSQIEFLIKRNHGLIRKILPLIDNKVNDKARYQFIDYIGSYGKYFSVNEDLFDAIAAELWSLIKIDNFKLDLKNKGSVRIEWLSKYLMQLYEGDIQDLESEIKEFIGFIN